MKILCIGDVHGNIQGLRYEIMESMQHLLDIDAVILVGDLGYNYLHRSDSPETNEHLIIKNIHHRDYVENVQSLFSTLRHYFTKQPIFAVPGNHDFKNVMEFVEEDGIVNLDRVSFDYGDLRLFGWGGAPQDVAFPYGFEDDAPIEDFFVESVAQADIIVSHCPPYGLCDRVLPSVCRRITDKMPHEIFEQGHDVNYLHVGSELVLEMLEKGYERVSKNRIVLCGHIHEDYGLGILGNKESSQIRVINLGSFGDPYRTNQLWVLDTSNSSIQSLRVPGMRSCWG